MAFRSRPVYFSGYWTPLLLILANRFEDWKDMFNQGNKTYSFKNLFVNVPLAVFTFKIYNPFDKLLMSI